MDAESILRIWDTDMDKRTAVLHPHISPTADHLLCCGYGNIGNYLIASNDEVLQADFTGGW